MPSSLLLLAALLASSGGSLLERILAVVDGRPVLLSEARTVEALRGVTRQQAVDALVDESLMVREAAQMPQAEPQARELDAALQGLLERWPEKEGPAPRPALLELARRQLRILKYVEFRFRPKVRVEESAVRDAYEAEVHGRPGDPGFEAAAAELQARLERRRLDEEVESWVKELRSAAEIRYNPDLAE